jgi:hypothetical protein
MSTTRGSKAEDRYGPIEATRRGAHRARPTPLAGMAPVAAVAVVVVAVILGLWFLVGGLTGGSDDGSDLATGPTVTAGGSEQPSVEPSVEPTPEQSTTAEEGMVDHAQVIRVLNNTGTQGLAKTAASALQSASWQVGEVGNHTPVGVVRTTTVYYAAAAQAATAQAVAADLGATRTRRSPTVAAKGITVILAADYRR